MSDTVKKSVTVSGPSYGACFMLFIVFLVLKLTGTIDWSWWWVTSPLWIPWAMLTGLFMLMGLIFAICYAIFGKRR